MITTNEKQKEIRCTHCDKKLAEGVALELKIKCPRCKQLNKFEKTPIKTP